MWQVKCARTKGHKHKGSGAKVCIEIILAKLSIAHVTGTMCKEHGSQAAQSNWHPIIASNSCWQTSAKSMCQVHVPKQKGHKHRRPGTRNSHRNHSETPLHKPCDRYKRKNKYRNVLNKYRISTAVLIGGAFEEEQSKWDTKHDQNNEKRVLPCKLQSYHRRGDQQYTTRGGKLVTSLVERKHAWKLVTFYMEISEKQPFPDAYRK